LWRLIDTLGDLQSYYLLERFVPGDIFHVDSIVQESEIRFAVASGYGTPPLEVSQRGGIFTTKLLERGSEVEQRLLGVNQKLLAGLGLTRGVSHSEFIRGREDGKIYFLETSARVGGAHIAELIETATGINMWAEWAKVELGVPGLSYTPRQDYAGLLVSLARDEYPDTSAFQDPELVWRLNRKNHVGFIVKSPEIARVQELLESYADRVRKDFHASAPALESPNE
jgi:hypothetical protein